MNKQLSEVESLCLSGVKKENPEMVEMYFGPYLAYSPATKNSAFIKAYMLLYYFSTGSKKMFYTTIETVTPMELEDRDIRLVMDVDMCVNIGAVERLRKLVESNSRKELHRFLQVILKNQVKTMELSASPSECIPEIQNQEDRKIIENAIFIGRSSPGNF
uniref:Uncharacterized protein n=1 Tax=Encephalitozoon cuniculi TaxID=6035 RepID=M1K717_ENCCN|nr:hypothetical protein ECU11_0410 [Encephalitozoon cuniculi]